MNHQRAIVDLLYEGYAGRKDHRVAPTVGLIRDRGVVVVVDPGMVPSPAAILDPLSALGLAAEDVTDVVFSHHHPDHTLSAALFVHAAFHDHWATYRHDVWQDRDAEGFKISANVSLIRVPGHSNEDIATVASTEDLVGGKRAELRLSRGCAHAQLPSGFSASEEEVDGLGARRIGVCAGVRWPKYALGIHNDG